MAEGSWQPLNGGNATSPEGGGDDTAPERGREFQQGIVVRNTFIDVCPLEEESDGDGEGSCASPQRRNASAPPSPTRQRNDRGALLDDSDQEEEEDPSAIPNYQWADGGLVTAEGADPPKEAADGDGAEGETCNNSLPEWLQKPPGSPKKIPAGPKKVVGKTSERPRPALGEFLKGGASPWGAYGGQDQQDGFGQGYGPGLGLGRPFDQHDYSHVWGHGADMGYPGGGLDGGGPYGAGPPSHQLPTPGLHGSGLSQPPAYNPRFMGRGRSGFNGAGLGSSPYEQDLWQDRGPPQLPQGFGAPSCQPVLSQPGSSKLWTRRDSICSGHSQDHTASLEPFSGGAYISDYPPPRDLLGGHIPTEAPAYVFGSSSTTTSAPVLASQPLPPQQVVDASRRQPAHMPPGGTFDIDGTYLGGLGPPMHTGGHYPIGRGIAGSAGAVGHMVPPERPSRYSGREGGSRGRAGPGGNHLAVGGAVSGAGGAGQSGPWISPSVHNLPWLSPRASASLEDVGSGGRGGKGGKGGGGGGGDDRGGGGKGDGGKGRVPLSGGGPKRTDYIKKYGAANEGEVATPTGGVPITTMMLKNIPCRKSQEEVMMHIDQKGFGNRYDFFYLPRDVKFRANLGYAFINFLTPEDASAFSAELNGYRFSGSGSTKACAVVPAHVQGLTNNLAAFKRTEVMRSSRKPYFSNAVNV